MIQCLLGLGSNLGDRVRNLETAVRRLADNVGIDLQEVSPWHETQAVGGPSGQPTFLNGAVRLTTSLSAPQLLAVSKSVENHLGRHRQVRWDARPIDIDLLLYGQEVHQTPELTIPHPWMAVRRFVLEPARAIAPDWVHPQLGWTVERMFRHVRSAGQRFVVKPVLPASFLPQICDSLGAKAIADPWIHGSSGLQQCEEGSGLGIERAIKSFELRRQRLIESGWGLAGAQVISDFWLNDPPAMIAGDQQANLAWSDYVRRRSTGIPPPKLIILCRSEPGHAAEADHARCDLGGSVRALGDCPWLVTTAETYEAVKQVVSAAYLSMQ